MPKALSTPKTNQRRAAATPPARVARLRTGRVRRLAGEALQRFVGDRIGSTSVIAAIMFPVVIGGIGLGVETGYWYMTQRELQHAADVAVHAAAVRKRSGDTADGMRTAALYIANQTGFSGSSGNFIVNSPVATGPNAGDPDTVEVLLSQIEPRLFSAMFSNEPVDIGARAVAKINETARACILALSPSAPGAVTVSGSTSLSLTGCDVASNSNASDSFLMKGAATLSTGCIYSVGATVTTAALDLTDCDQPKEYAAAVADPYASVAEPVVQGTCQSKNVGKPNASTTLTPVENHPSGVAAMRFCNGLSIKGDVVFQPGLYIIEGGDFTVNGGSVDPATAGLVGLGVTFYLTNGAGLKLGGNTRMNLSAPMSGPFSGILFFGGRDQTGITHTVAGTSDSILQGAVYMPAGDLKYRGNSSTGDGCTQIVGYTVDLSGNSTFESHCEEVGGSDIVSSALIRIIE
ncbi:pilus assembly protein TadG-related protein [Aurantimonas sp. C2-6-R+9]|uniref:pilus assembly protein TadG-related protein n=1 Tax=unclassified Aurantimonas TaxID=2638230 RepID=UPI002E1777E8|nr:MULTISPECIES: pilus assembly protein TadG-related protein [unclassified Aurantimonas]MEC5290973.1 pilus assembly protein TadG-related protein [Aurantimonas sp. C2-3-R2]MEC5381272.1 pilus assembly protein TadG-related protein [Aurantimonas sp. C2-6-R+9]MEC5412094.1 pilus assembly protein TadG-related protein [Aurantimonas sp. C2-4-R8]